MVNKISMITASAVALAFGLLSNHAPSQRELNGYFLGQHEQVVKNTLKEPFQTDKLSDGAVVKVHWLDPEKKAFMAFTYLAENPETIAAIQLTGQEGTDMFPFDGLELGDARKKVVKVLGEPDKEEPMSDIPGKFLYYEDRNYSVELDENDRLSSIKINGFRGFEKFEKQKPDYDLLRKALKEEDVDAVLDSISPDIEIYRGVDDTLGFALPARMELSDDDSPMYKALFDDKSGIRAVLAGESEREESIRMTERKTLLMVATYPKNKALKEVVYRWQAGKWRVWEITLKE